MRTYFFLAVLTVATLAAGQSNISTVPDSDPFSDADRTTVRVVSENQSRFSRTNTLVWRCNGSTNYELFVMADEYLGGDRNDRVPIVYRFDEKPAVSERWNESTQGTAAFASSSQRRNFTQGALEADRVVIGLSDYRGQRYTYAFRLAGLRRHLEDVGCVGVTPVFSDIHTSYTIPNAYGRLKEVVAGHSYTEGLNVMYFDGLTVHFVDANGKARLVFEGTNRDLYEHIANAFF